MRYAVRRDRNEPELISLARRLGARLWQMHEPADWLLLHRGRWEVVEIKVPEKQVRADEFTQAQREFTAEVFSRGGRVLVRRTTTDVHTALGRGPQE